MEVKYVQLKMRNKIFIIILFSILFLVVCTIFFVQAAQTSTVVPTDSMYYSPDASGSCTLSNIQTAGDALTCSLVTMDIGETGYINITHASSIPDGAENPGR